MNDRDVQLCPPLAPNQSATQEEREDTTNLQIIDCPPFHKLVPPLNFCPVDKDLYRSGQPSPINFAFLDTLKLKTIVWLAVEDPTEAFLAYADTSDITIHHLGLPEDNSHSWDQLTEYTIRQALDIIVNKQTHPCLVCCGMGRHRTGAVIGCLRRLEKWNLSSVSEEYRRFAGSRGRVLIELLIEAFDTKSIRVNPATAPSWLLG